MTILCRCINKCLGICRRSRRVQSPQDPLLPFTEPSPKPDVVPDVVHPQRPAAPIPPPPKASEIVRTPKPARSSKPTRLARRGRVSNRGGVTKPSQAAKLKLDQAAKPAEPKEKDKGKAQKTAGDSEGNISDEEYPPLPPSREGSHTGITPEMSDIDINEPRDIDIQDAEPGDELLSYPRTPTGSQTALLQKDDTGQGDTSSDEILYFGSRSPADIPMTPAPQGEQGGERSPGSGKRGHIEDIAQGGHEWSPASTSEYTSSPAKHIRIDEASLQTQARVPAGPRLSPSRLNRSPPPVARSTSSSGSGYDVDDDLWPKPTEEELATYRRKGAQLVAWLEDPNEPNCNIAQATITLDDLLINAPEEDRFQVGQTYFQNLGELLEGGEPESMGLTTEDNRYRFTSLSSRVKDPAILERFGVERMSNSFAHIIGPGIIFATSIFRHDCVQWNEIARALYVRDHLITTLRHIMYSTVVNDETASYIRRIAYPRYDLSFDTAASEPCLIIERGTREYEELLGTKLGKATAIFLISSLPRGTIRIARAAIWNCCHRVELRFEFEPIPGNP
ncbi:hypothetical protein N7449_011885 [Penicillium cf. viridicatum]|uniref:Uncharacterized protein n=1 Tax=Penicillium cf. viridicatum TaxID=2972119 RepID=A0A9W9IMC6_9EURO|nr:hypothetical protein N7449_011885 [Penicillium cf. viridicatum]